MKKNEFVDFVRTFVRTFVQLVLKCNNWVYNKSICVKKILLTQRVCSRIHGRDYDRRNYRWRSSHSCSRSQGCSEIRSRCWWCITNGRMHAWKWGKSCRHGKACLHLLRSHLLPPSSSSVTEPYLIQQHSSQLRSFCKTSSNWPNLDRLRSFCNTSSNWPNLGRLTSCKTSSNWPNLGRLTSCKTTLNCCKPQAITFELLTKTLGDKTLKSFSKEVNNTYQCIKDFEKCKLHFMMKKDYRTRGCVTVYANIEWFTGVSMSFSSIGRKCHSFILFSN